MEPESLNNNADLNSVLQCPEILSGHIDRDGPIPLYYQIKQILIRYISRCSEGDIFPAETRLCEIFAVSRPTVRQAINELVREGLVDRTAGKGTFVTASKVRRDFKLTFQTFNNEMQAAGHSSDTRILAMETQAANEVLAAQLGIRERDTIYKLQRLRTTDGSSLVYMVNYLPEDLLPGLKHKIKLLKELRRTIEKEYGHNLVRATRRLEAVSADSLQAEHLGIPVGVPLQFIETHIYTENGRCVEYSNAWYRGDKSSFFVELDRKMIEAP